MFRYEYGLSFDLQGYYSGMLLHAKVRLLYPSIFRYEYRVSFDVQWYTSDMLLHTKSPFALSFGIPVCTGVGGVFGGG